MTVFLSHSDSNKVFP